VFNVSGKVNTHNCRIWGSEKPCVSLEHILDNPKVNEFCALSKEKVYNPFFLEATITGVVYLDMLRKLRNVYKMLYGKLEPIGLLDEPKHRWKNITLVVFR
jgi:hypothetical protein